MRKNQTWLAVIAGLLAVICACGLVLSQVIAKLKPPSPSPAIGEMRVAMLDIGQGDSIVVIAPDGECMLVDGGNSAADGREVIVPYLQSHGCDPLNVLVLTHPDADHVGGLPTVLRSIPVKAVVLTGQLHTTQIYAEFLQEVQEAKKKHGTKVIKGLAGAKIPFDPAVKVEILAPGTKAVKTDDMNNASIVIKLTYGQVGVLLTGDAEREEEQWMIAHKADLHAQILKVSHHGSRNGSSDQFLKAVGAEIGLISCGADNRYGHPHAEVLERLARHGFKVYRTDRQGTIEVLIDGRGYQVKTAK